MKRLLSVVIVALLVLGMLTLTLRIQPARSSPTTITVPDNYSTIQAAVDAANPYDTILVRAGSYPENVTVNKNNLVIMGQYSHTAVVHGWFYLDTISNTTIANFTILGSSSQYSDGIFFQQSSFNTIRNNNISSWYDGIYFNYLNNTINPPADPTTCHNNTVAENDISNCYCAIFFMEGLTNNRFYHNNFYTTIIDYMIPDNEFWDNGYPSGGNYWSGIPTVDEKCGPNQNQPGNDGMNDTAYTEVYYGETMNGVQGVDHYPLVSPWSPPDIGVTNVTSSKTVVGQGGTVYINATLRNQGSKVEEFNLTVYVNTTVVGYWKNIVFLVGSGSAVCSWNTTGFAYGNYTLSAYVWPVPSETNVADNNFTGGTIKVTIAGDVNGDKTIDIYDAIVLAGAYNSKPGDPNWKPNADINGDNIVDIYDAIILANHYNQHYP